MWQQCNPHKRQIVSVAHCSNLKTMSSEWHNKRIPVIIMTEHMVNLTKLGLRFHHNASLIKNSYCNCETPILFQLFKQNLMTLEKKKKGKKKKTNNNRCIIVIK